MTGRGGYQRMSHPHPPRVPHSPHIPVPPFRVEDGVIYDAHHHWLGRVPHSGGLDPSAIFSKTFKFAGHPITVTAHDDGSRTLDFGHAGAVRLTAHELRELDRIASDMGEREGGVGQGDYVRRFVRENYDAAGNVVSVATQPVIVVRKLAEPPDMTGDDETWDLTPISLHVPDPANPDPSWDEVFAQPAAKMRVRDLSRLVDAATHLPAERFDNGAGQKIDVFRDGGRVTIRVQGGPHLVLDRKSARALYHAINGLWDDEGRDPRPAGETENVTVRTNIGDVLVGMTGEADVVELDTALGRIVFRDAGRDYKSGLHGLMDALDDVALTPSERSASPGYQRGLVGREQIPFDALGQPREPATVEVAGLAVVADDTGRVLMIQRANADNDPAGGHWELPGGHLEDDEQPLDAAYREWCEETGLPLPTGDVAGSWRHGIYQGFVLRIPSEDDLNVFDGRDFTSDPDSNGDMIEALAWWDPEHVSPENPAVRPELRDSVDDFQAALTARPDVAHSPTAARAALSIVDALLGAATPRQRAVMAQWQRAARVLSRDVDGPAIPLGPPVIPPTGRLKRWRDYLGRYTWSPGASDAEIAKMRAEYDTRQPGRKARPPAQKKTAAKATPPAQAKPRQATPALPAPNSEKLLADLRSNPQRTAALQRMRVAELRALASRVGVTGRTKADLVNALDANLAPPAPDPFDLHRFVEAQDDVFDEALAELENGHKDTHWMWFVFPQIAGLGSSSMSKYYAIGSLDEARAYLADPVLGPRLREVARVVAGSDAASAEDIFGSIDARKLRASMTLFHRADPDEPAFTDVLDRFFDGVPDEATDSQLDAIAHPPVDPAKFADRLQSRYPADPRAELDRLTDADLADVAAELGVDDPAAGPRPLLIEQAVEQLAESRHVPTIVAAERSAKARAGRPSGYPKRQRVPGWKASWTASAAFSDYNPPEYTARDVLDNDRTKKAGGWADPPDPTGLPPFRSTEGALVVDERGRPRNPVGRTGLQGRGRLGRWGANPAADTIITRDNPRTGQLEMAAVQRPSGEWAIPGGMVDDGETPLAAGVRELLEETGASVDPAGFRTVYQGYVDDPRNTDNAWIESTVMHRHLTRREAAKVKFTNASVKAGETKGVRWQPVTPEFLAGMYASHGPFVRDALKDRLPVTVDKPRPDAKFESLPKAERGRSGNGRRNPGAPWGWYGASGVLVRARGDDDQERFLLVKGARVDAAGLWQLPGGARDEKESPYQGAARETAEELGADTAAISALRPVGEHVLPHSTGWTYTTLLADSRTQFDTDVDGVETADAQWFTRDELRGMAERGEIQPNLAHGLDAFLAAYPQLPKPVDDAEFSRLLPALTSGSLAKRQHALGQLDDDQMVSLGQRLSVVLPDRTRDGLEAMDWADLRDLARDWEINFAYSLTSRPSDTLVNQLIKELRAKGAVAPGFTDRDRMKAAVAKALQPYIDARTEIDARLRVLGRRMPADVKPIEAAVKAIGDGTDRKAIAASLRTAAGSAKSSEDAGTLRLLAQNITRKNPAPPPYVTATGDLDVVKLAELNGLDLRRWMPSILPNRMRTYLDANPHDSTFRDAVDGAAHATPRRRKRQAEYLRGRAGSIKTRRETWLAQAERIGTSQEHPWDKSEIARAKSFGDWHAYVDLGPDAIADMERLADLLETVKMPPRPKPRTLGVTTVSEAVPIDESRFKERRLRDVLLHRGQRIPADLTHTNGRPVIDEVIKKARLRPGLTKEESRAADLYASRFIADPLNGGLRAGKDLTEHIVDLPGVGKIDLAEVQSSLDSAIAHSELTQDSILYRASWMTQADVNRLIPGAIYHESSYLSTSLGDMTSPRRILGWRLSVPAGGGLPTIPKGRKPVVFRILAPKGTHAILGHEGVSEALLSRQSDMRVVRADESITMHGIPGNVQVVTMELLPASEGRRVPGRRMVDEVDYAAIVATPDRGGSWGSGGVEDTWNAIIAKAQGFDGKPQVVPQADMDDIVEGGAVELWRGVGRGGETKQRRRQMAEQFRVGDLFSGQGVYGNGTYTSTAKADTGNYAQNDEGGIIRMALRRDARVIAYKQLQLLQRKVDSGQARKLNEQEQEELSALNPSDLAGIARVREKYAALRRRSTPRARVVSELGRLASLLGYDAIRVPKPSGFGGDLYVILNRTAVIVQEGA